MTSSAWILLVVLWQGLAPSVSAYPVDTKAHCEKLAHSFAAGEDAINDNAPPTERDSYYVRCTLANGGEANAA